MIGSGLQMVIVVLNELNQKMKFDLSSESCLISTAFREFVTNVFFC